MYRHAGAVLLVTLCFAAGCSTKVVVPDQSIPQPLIDKLALKVGARYPESFDKFVHEETVIGKDTWEIDLGKSNRLMFDKLFESMFSNFQVVEGDAAPGDFGLDALIEPTIDAFEFSVPEQSQTDAFAVWIRYRIRIFDRDGNQVANWPISAYGKSMTTTFGGDDALRRAAILAMRDAAALIILQMDKSTGISGLAQANASGSPGETPTDNVEELNDDSG